MPAVTSARSVSIFIRPPRPWPSWRRARSRSTSSGRSSRPAGRPSSTAVRPGPCDSPAVVKRSAIGLLPYWRGRALLSRLGARDQPRQHGAAGVGDRLAAVARCALAVVRAAVRRVALGLCVADALTAELHQLEVVGDAAVLGAEGLLV